MKLRLTRENRLNQAEQYRQVFKSSFKIRDRDFLFIARRNGGGQARLGLAISKKKVKKASKRNLLKRLIRESFRKSQRKLTGLDVVVVSQNNIEKFDRGRICESLRNNWQKLQQCKK